MRGRGRRRRHTILVSVFFVTLAPLRGRGRRETHTILVSVFLVTFERERHKKRHTRLVSYRY